MLGSIDIASRLFLKEKTTLVIAWSEMISLRDEIEFKTSLQSEIWVLLKMLYSRGFTPSVKLCGTHLNTWGPFLESPGNFSGP